VSPAARDRGLSVGVMALEDGARVDFARLRHARRARVFTAMADRGLDALLLGGVGDVRYVSGARQLGRAGVLPFAPVAVAVRTTGRVHLLSTWDEGVPPEIGRECLYGLTWNPAILMDSVAAIPGMAESRRIGTDGLTPTFAEMVSSALPSAEIIDAANVLTVARRTKTPDEVICIEVAAAIAEAALSALDDALTAGVTERELLGVYYERIANHGAPVAPSESVCFATESTGPVRFRHLASDRPIRKGELVVLAPSALYAGYEAGLARTRIAGRAWTPGATELADHCARSMDALLAVCRPGRTGADLYRAWQDVGNPEAHVPLAHGLGLGAEPPLIGLGRGRSAMLEEGMVLAVNAWVTRDGVGGCLERATVRIDSAHPTMLTRSGRST
jgi:Xaa-Pro dipeptidase